MKPGIIVHGGAYDIPERFVDANLTGCRRAAESGFEVLRAGGTSVDAVEQAVAAMEDDPTFDAGRGSVLNQAGYVEMDAIIMDGRTLRSGGVAALRHIANPVRVARRVLEDTPYSLLAGDGALHFATESGFRECSEEDLLVGRELEDYREFVRTGVLKTREYFSGQAGDTVGACALDSSGNLACATSTGGIPRKMPGRVGDSPLVGSGAYADNTLGAASATGWGEAIMSVVLSKTCLDLLERSGDAMEAARGAVGVLESRTKSFGGVILVDPKGSIGYHHNTPKMAFAFVSDGGDNRGVGVRQDDVRRLP
jgi:beta-aspartyl-peptidase (threonine type)